MRRSLKPIMNKVVDEYPGRVHYVLVDIEKDPEIAEAAGVNGTPTMQMFKVGACVATMRLEPMCRWMNEAEGRRGRSMVNASSAAGVCR